MPQRKVSNYSELAELAGVSKATVSLALRNNPKISEATRQRIQNLARDHGYETNPLVTAQMVNVQRGKRAKSAVATMAMIAPKSLNDAMQDMNTPLQYYYMGVTRRAAVLGFKIDYISLLPEDTKNKRLNGILEARGMKGVIFAPLTEDYPLNDFDFEWKNYSVVAIEHTFDKPKIHSVCNDEFESIGRMIDRLQRQNFKRIGIALMELEDLHVKHYWVAGYQTYNYLIPKERQLEPFITNNWTQEGFIEWFERSKPEVIICIDDTVSIWLERAGYRVPEDVQLATLYWLPSRSWLSGFYQNHEVMGAAAVDLLSAQLYRNEYGLPDDPKKVLIQSEWKEGKTLKEK